MTSKNDDSNCQGSPGGLLAARPHMPMQRVGFLGAGNMAEAILSGLLAEALLSPSMLAASDKRPERLRALAERHGIATYTDNRALTLWADVLILAVKPQALPGALAEISNLPAGDTLFVSIAAGIPISLLERALGEGARVIRTMPNTPALIQAGATVLCAGSKASDDDMDIAERIFEAVGITERMPECKIDAVTGLSGSGPAYAFLLLEALRDAGVSVGLPAEAALRLSAQTLMGSAKLLLETDGDPAALRAMVTSPGGTSLAGLRVLEDANIRTTLSAAVAAATARARELGQDS